MEQHRSYFNTSEGWEEKKSDKEKWSWSFCRAANLVKSTENTCEDVRWLDTLPGWVRIFTSGERTLGSSGKKKSALPTDDQSNHSAGTKGDSQKKTKKTGSASIVGRHMARFS